jgi:hypothetical protein
VNHRGAVGADGGGLALQRIQPPVGPVGEADVQPGPVVTLLDRILQAEQRQLSLVAISANNLPVRVLALADDNVVGGPPGTRAPHRRVSERRPGTAKSAPGAVLRLKASHLVILMSNYSLHPYSS